MKVKLKFPHTHAGVSYPAGAEIDVQPLEAIWLKGQDLVHQEWDTLKAELKKLATKETPAPYADELASAQASAVTRPASDVADASAAAASTTIPAASVATQDASK